MKRKLNLVEMPLDDVKLVLRNDAQIEVSSWAFENVKLDEESLYKAALEFHLESRQLYQETANSESNLVASA